MTVKQAMREFFKPFRQGKCESVKKSDDIKGVFFPLQNISGYYIGYVVRCGMPSIEIHSSITGIYRDNSHLYATVHVSTFFREEKLEPLIAGARAQTIRAPHRGKRMRLMTTLRVGSVATDVQEGLSLLTKEDAKVVDIIAQLKIALSKVPPKNTFFWEFEIPARFHGKRVRPVKPESH